MVDGPCGSLKTFATCKHIAMTHKSGRGMFVVCSPTKALVDQTETMLREAGGKHIHCIHEDCSKNIQGDIRLATKDIAEAGFGTLLITNASFDRILHRPTDWDLIIDEIPRYDTFYELSIPRKFGLLTEYIETRGVLWFWTTLYQVAG